MMGGLFLDNAQTSGVLAALMISEKLSFSASVMFPSQGLGNSDPKMLIYAGARVLSVFTLQISPRLCGAQDKRLKA